MKRIKSYVLVFMNNLLITVQFKDRIKERYIELAEHMKKMEQYFSSDDESESKKDEKKDEENSDDENEEQIIFEIFY